MAVGEINQFLLSPSPPPSNQDRIYLDMQADKREKQVGNRKTRWA